MNSVKTRVYTRVAKWYNLVALTLISAASILGIISTLTLSIINSVEFDLAFTLEMFRLGTMAVTGIISIFGIAQEKKWAKWFAVFTYGICLFGVTEGLISSFSSAYYLFISSSVILALRISRLVIITLCLLGIVLLFLKTRSGDNSEERE